MTMDIKFSELRHLIQPNAEGAYTATIAGSPVEIKTIKHPLPKRNEADDQTFTETWSVTVAGKLVVTQTDDIDHAWNQAMAYAEQIAFNICGPRLD